MEEPDKLPIPSDADILLAVSDSELIVRRFNPHNPEHYTSVVVDEGDSPRYQLTNGAFDGFSVDGCSVYRDVVLQKANIDRSDLLQPPKYICLAEATVADVEGVVLKGQGGASSYPFVVRPDAYPARESPERSDVAHALIQIDVSTKADRRIAVGKLARLVFKPVLGDLAPPH